MTIASAASRERPRDLIAAMVAKKILSGAFVPSTKLPTETELVERFCVSRTALRESIRTLVGKGTIESRTRFGTIVLPSTNWSHLDPYFARILTEAREAIEPAAHVAAERATGQDLGRIQESDDAMWRAAAGDIGGERHCR